MSLLKLEEIFTDRLQQCFAKPLTGGSLKVIELEEDQLAELIDEELYGENLDRPPNWPNGIVAEKSPEYIAEQIITFRDRVENSLLDNSEGAYDWTLLVVLASSPQAYLLYGDKPKERDMHELRRCLSDRWEYLQRDWKIATLNWFYEQQKKDDPTVMAFCAVFYGIGLVYFAYNVPRALCKMFYYSFIL
jgi:hypothetical protein